MQRMFGRKKGQATNGNATNGNAYPEYEQNVTPPHQSTEEKGQRLPHHNGNQSQKHSWIKEDGNANRRGFHPWHFLHCCFRSTSKVSMVVNVLWPLVPAAIAVVSIETAWKHACNQTNDDVGFHMGSKA